MSARILVIDDNRTNLDLMLYLLRAFGHDPVGAGDGLSGLEAARESEFDLVLSDILMPGIDGFELARRFKADERLKTVRLVAVTALAMVGDRDRVLASGFDGYIAKPIEPETFVLRVDAFLPAELRSIVTIEDSSPSVSITEPGLQEGPVILAVDDVQVNLDVIHGALQPFGFHVVEARNAREALERARELKPALILCDVHMPQGDGFDLIENVKGDEQLRDIPFLFISSTVWRTRDRIRGIEMGAEKFLLRPIDPALLVEEVEQALKNKRAEDPDR